MVGNGENKQRIEYAEICKTITLLEKQGREIHDHDKIIERIEEFYTEPSDSEQSTIIYTDPKEVPEITSWEVEAALGDIKNGTATGNDLLSMSQCLHRGIESRRRYHLEDTY